MGGRHPMHRQRLWQDHWSELAAVACIDGPEGALAALRELVASDDIVVTVLSAGGREQLHGNGGLGELPRGVVEALAEADVGTSVPVTVGADGVTAVALAVGDGRIAVAATGDADADGDPSFEELAALVLVALSRALLVEHTKGRSEELR